MRLAATVTVLVILGVPALSGCGGGANDSAHSPPPAPFQLDFESGLTTGTDVGTVKNSGEADVQTVVRTNGDATVKVVPGRDGGHAVQFPAYTGAPDASSAVLVATEKGNGALDPGSGEFSFGATFRLDAESSGSAADNGNNLLQRGSFDSPGQLKLQLDHDVPSCRVKGDAGEAFVKADAPVDPGAWYSVSCTRKGSDLELAVKAYGEGASGGTWHVSAPTGTVAMDGLPLTIGGKTGPDGKPVASADQFNGAVDDVFFRGP